MMVQNDSSPGEQFLRPDSALHVFAGSDDLTADFELTPGTTGWLRLILAAGCLTVAVAFTGERFLQYVIHHVWDQSRNSPVALIVPVLAIEFLWVIAHVETGGLIARLKIGLGAAATCVAVFAPNLGAGGGADGAMRSIDMRQLCAFLLAMWVFVDGWRDRRSNLQDHRSHDLAGQRP